MMNIYEFAQKYDISVKKVRKMHKAGVLLIDDTEHPLADEMRACLSKGQPLSTIHLLALIENPRLAWQLGRYAKKAQAQVDALGDPTTGAAPREIGAKIYSGICRDEDSIGSLIAWLKEIIPTKAVGHQYVAVRLALGIPIQIRAAGARCIPAVLLHSRKHPEFAAWWRIEKVGWRNRTFYCRPEKLFDL
ncbi:MAG: hypothetical protein K2Y17_07200 [Qipengyuania sp.]|nr:hypothetical protein [Qipengyuania sp.]